MGFGSRYPALVLVFIGGAIFLGACSGSAAAPPVQDVSTTVAVPGQEGDLPQGGFGESTTTLPEPLTTIGSTIVAESPEGEVAGAEEATLDLEPLRLPAGTCFNDPPADAEFVTPDNVAIVACQSEHDNEVYGNLDLGGGEFPGNSDVERRASSFCLSAFELYVGVDYQESTLDFSWYFPSEESWSAGGTAIICFAYNADLSPVVGSVAGSGL